MFSHCTINKSANLYTILPVMDLLEELAKLSINIILLPNIFPIRHIGPAVWAPVVTIYLGFILI